MSLAAHPEDVERWQYIVKDMHVPQAERDGWLCLVVGFSAALVAGGLIGMIMAKTWLPMWARAVLTIGVFIGVLIAAKKACEARQKATEDTSGGSDADTAPAAREAAGTTTAAVSAAAAPTAPEPAASEAAADIGTRPAALDGARGGTPDDLTRIKGVGPKLAELCHTLGFYHFDQIAAWTDDEVAWVDENLEGFKGRVSRDEWVSQAKVLAEGGETEFSARQ
ncbi:MAG: NADH:ubiquinone oxidoreductase [Pseudomonadota bacterium]